MSDPKQEIRRLRAENKELKEKLNAGEERTARLLARLTVAEALAVIPFRKFSLEETHQRVDLALTALGITDDEEDDTDPILLMFVQAIKRANARMHRLLYRAGQIRAKEFGQAVTPGCSCMFCRGIKEVARAGAPPRFEENGEQDFYYTKRIDSALDPIDRLLQKSMKHFLLNDVKDTTNEDPVEPKKGHLVLLRPIPLKGEN